MLAHEINLNDTIESAVKRLQNLKFESLDFRTATMETYTLYILRIVIIIIK